AQATKVPVLAEPTAGVTEVVEDGKTGFLIPTYDAPGYAGSIETLLRNPDLRRRVTEDAFAAVVRRHTLSAYCGAVQDLLEGPHAGPGAGSERITPGSVSERPAATGSPGQ